jgi:subtilisin family serine protease
MWSLTMARQARPRGPVPNLTSPTAAIEATTSENDLKPGVLITFRQDAMTEAVAQLSNAVGLNEVAYSSDFHLSSEDPPAIPSGGMLVFQSLGVAVADAAPDQEGSMSMLAGGDSAVATVEPEPIFYAFADGTSDMAQYLRGYRDAVNHLYDQIVQGRSTSSRALGRFGQERIADAPEATWGLVATKVLQSKFTGKGVRIAILDTGMDLDHPDFTGRTIVSKSFIPGQAPQDDNGHGTHCAGTACGPRSPVLGRRYGIASDAELYIGKVLSNRGTALGRSTLAGIEWAVSNKCDIISMSLGSQVQPGQTYLQAFEATARQALRNGSLIVAAAGNDSRRSQGLVKPVSSPANCPSILAVAAVDTALNVADFSNGATNPEGRVDIAAPGVEVYSSAPEPAATPQPPYYRKWAPQNDTLSGTSMATPHVAGILALLKQENPHLNASELWRIATSRALTLRPAAEDVGTGMIQA